MKRAALYARVSTDDKGQDPEMQLAPLREYCKTRGWTVVKEYVDAGWSGADSTRPAFSELKDDVWRRRFDIVLVWAFDRFARSVFELIVALDLFRAHAIEFRSHTQDIDTTTPFGKVIFMIIAAMAELERELFTERVNAGMARARAKGVTFGRPRAEADPAYIMRRRAEGASWATIAKELKVSRDTCRRVAQKAAQNGVEK